MDNRNLITIGLILIISISQISALGVSSPYWKNNPLKMYPGQETKIEFTLLQSTEERESAFVLVSITEGSEIAKLISGEQYNVKPGSLDNKIILEITLPENADIGDTYKVAFSVVPDSKSETGNIQVGIKYNIDFPILITEKSEASSISDKKYNFNIAILAVVVIIFILIIILIKLKKRKKKKKNA